MECPSNCRLLLETDARTLSLGIRVVDTPREFGEFVAREGGRVVGKYRNMDFQQGEQRFEIQLEGAGRMRMLDVLLPHNLDFVFTSLELDGALGPKPAAPKPAWLALGDSITQGMNIVSPSCLATRRVADALGIGAWNLGIGGAVMDVAPFGWAFARAEWRVITVALGSNDWLGHIPLDTVRAKTHEMVDAARAGAPKARLIFIVSPAERARKRPSGPPIEVYRDAVAEFAAGKGAHVIDGRTLAEHDMGHFTPDGLHLSDAGGIAYAERLLAAPAFADAFGK